MILKKKKKEKNKNLKHKLDRETVICLCESNGGVDPELLCIKEEEAIRLYLKLNGAEIDTNGKE